MLNTSFLDFEKTHAIHTHKHMHKHTHTHTHTHTNSDVYSIAAFCKNTNITREGFLRKNIVAVSFFQNCAIHPYSSYISFPLNEIIQA